MDTITGRITKILFRNDDFHILSVSPLAGKYNRKSLNDKFGTISIKGETSRVMHEGDILTFRVKETFHQKYGYGYDMVYVSNEFPDEPTTQKQLYNALTMNHGNQSDIQIMHNLFKSLDTLNNISDSDLTPYAFINYAWEADEELFSSRLASVLNSFSAPDKYRNWAKSLGVPDDYLTDFSKACQMVNADIDELYENMAKTLHRTEVKASVLIEVCKALEANGQPMPKRDDKWLFDLSLLECVHDAMENGDTSIDLIDIRKRVMYMRGMQNPATFYSMLDNRPEDSHLIVENEFIMISEYYDAEKNIIDFTMNPHHYDADLSEELDEYQALKGVHLNDEQRKFANMVFTSNIAVLTGGAGTGKSFTLGILVEFLRSIGANVICTAPTAQAAKVLKDYTNGPTKTIHSFLASADTNDTPTKNYLIIDESSMLDTLLCDKIINYARESGCVLIFSGDVGQLPPVDCGAPYRDILDATPNNVRLETIYRQKDMGLINILNQARRHEFNVRPQSEWNILNGCLRYKHYNSASETIQTCIDMIKKYGLNNVGILSPVNREVNSVNIELQSILNPQTKVAIASNASYGKGDPVILLKNKQYALASNLTDEYAQAVHDPLTGATINTYFPEGFEFQTSKAYNGDSGIVIEVLSNAQFIVELDDGTQLLFDTNDSREEISSAKITLGYAMTVHKSQGSQFKHIIALVPYTHESMTSGPLIYTMLSRAKESITLFSQGKFSNIDINRNTYFSTMI